MTCLDTAIIDRMELDHIRGCIGQTHQGRIGLYECKDCPAMQRANCPRPVEYEYLVRRETQNE